ncbi:MAG TPA: hypothetical protein V6C58_01345 [Allocoleopsis sp.]
MNQLNPEFEIGEIVKISDLIYDNPIDSEAMIIDYHKTIDEIDGGRTFAYDLITERLGRELQITERFLERI